jgi:uncharacterized protein YndB with AHSA1/START domain
MKKYLFLLLAVLLAGAVNFALAAVDLSGTWEMTWTSPRGGEMKSELTIVQTGEKLEVTMKSAGRSGNVMESKGTGSVKDQAVEFTITRTTQRGEFTTTYKGTIENDNTLSGKAEMGQMGSMDWRATRKPK